jgi:probable F420-dependent oxidoreductase
MKIRIGIGLGGLAPDRFVGAVQCMERCGFDSLWLSEVLTTGVLDPLSGLAFAAGVTTKLKLGTTMTVTGRNPVRMAKELATIDRLSNGRLLLVFVPGLTNRVEDQALGIPVKERGAWLDEILPLTRRLWSEDNVTHQGPLFCYAEPGITLQPRPLQNPLEVWLGGNAKSALRRAGKLSDGWLPSLCTPSEAKEGREAIQAAAAEVGRQLDPEHFGISMTYARQSIPASQVTRIQQRRPNLDPAEVVPVGPQALRDLLQRYIDAGFSKFVVRPAEPPQSWEDEMQQLAGDVLSLQT